MEHHNLFRPGDRDEARSPHSGLGLAQWLDAGRWFLDGLLSHVAHPDAPLRLPKMPGKSYPRDDEPGWRVDCAELEAVVRSLNLVAPMLEREPGLTVRGLAVGPYYARRLLALTRPWSSGGLPRPDDVPEVKAVQITCEAGGLAAQLLLCPSLWRRFTAQEQAQIADFLSVYAHARTGGHNWRYFNVMMLLFLLRQGYPADAGLLHRHLEALLALHVGEGWFLDGHVDYYTHWVFHLYGALIRRFGPGWIDPDLLAQSRAQADALAPHYPRLFSRDGRMIMWGRSICYRTAVASALPWLCTPEEPLIDPGWARRIASGNLLQFAGRADFLEQGLPALGFHGPFEPAIQPYSCSASPMWMHLTFLSALSQPDDTPFWQARENEGEWERWTSPTPRLLVSNGAAVRIVNYPASGETELQTGGIEVADPMYQRLSFHSRYPVEPLDPAEGMAMHYAWTSPDFFGGDTQFHGPCRNDWVRERDGVLYRRLQMSDTVLGNYPYLDLADCSVPAGTVRMDRARLFHGERLRLCHYALSHRDGAPRIERRAGDGWEALIASTPADSLALVRFRGWERLGCFVHQGFHPDGTESTVLFAECRFAERYPDTAVPFVAALLHRTDGGTWTDDELRVVLTCDERFRRGALELRLIHGRLRICRVEE